MELLFYSTDTASEQSEFLGNISCFPGNDALSCDLFNVVETREEISTEEKFKLNFLTRDLGQDSRSLVMELYSILAAVFMV